MGRPSWATAEQKTLLESFRSSFYHAQATRTHKAFWATIYEAWFARYRCREPLPAEYDFARLEVNKIAAPDLSDARREELIKEKASWLVEETVRNKIADYCWNRFRSNPNVAKSERISIVPAKKPRDLTLPHAYSGLFENEVKKVARERTAAAQAVDPNSKKSNYVGNFNSVAKELYDEAPEDIKKMVLEYQQKYNEDLEKSFRTSLQPLAQLDESGLSPEEAEQQRVQRLQLIVRKLNNLPECVRSVMTSIYRDSGFTGVIGLVGPNPERAGELATFIYCIGEEDGGQNRNFTQYYPRFEPVFRDQLATFGREVYLIAAPSLRSQFALPGTNTSEKHQPQATTFGPYSPIETKPAADGILLDGKANEEIDNGMSGADQMNDTPHLEFSQYVGWFQNAVPENNAPRPRTIPSLNNENYLEKSTTQATNLRKRSRKSFGSNSILEESDLGATTDVSDAAGTGSEEFKRKKPKPAPAKFKSSANTFQLEEKRVREATRITKELETLIRPDIEDVSNNRRQTLTQHDTFQATPVYDGVRPPTPPLPKTREGNAPGAFVSKLTDQSVAAAAQGIRDANHFHDTAVLSCDFLGNVDPVLLNAHPPQLDVSTPLAIADADVNGAVIAEVAPVTLSSGGLSTIENVSEGGKVDITPPAKAVASEVDIAGVTIEDIHGMASVSHGPSQNIRVDSASSTTPPQLDPSTPPPLAAEAAINGATVNELDPEQAILGTDQPTHSCIQDASSEKRTDLQRNTIQAPLNLGSGKRRFITGSGALGGPTIAPPGPAVPSLVIPESAANLKSFTYHLLGPQSPLSDISDEPEESQVPIASTVENAVKHPKEQIAYTVDQDSPPHWMKLVHDTILKDSTDKDLIALVGAWQEFEAKLGYPADNKYNVLSVSNAPKPIKSFMKSSSYTRLPNVTNTDTFAKHFREWWISLQPAWRIVPPTTQKAKSPNSLPLRTTAPPPEENWSELRKGGPSGCSVLLYSLSGWLKVVRGAKERKEWQACAQDVKWVLERII